MKISRIIGAIAALAFFHASAAPIQRIADIGRSVQPQSGNPHLPAQLGSRWILTLCTGSHGCQPWSMDASGTDARMLGDLFTPAFADGTKVRYVTAGSLTYFHAPDSSGYSIYATDGTAAGTRAVAPAAAAQKLVASGTKIFFTGADGSLRSFDGATLSGPIVPAAIPVEATPASVVFFSTTGNGAFGAVDLADQSVHTYNGTPGASILSSTSIGNHVYFVQKTASGYEWWTIDGTQPGVMVSMPPNDGISPVVAFNGSAYVAIAQGSTLFLNITNPTGTGAALTTPIGGSYGDNGLVLQPVGGLLYFTGGDATHFSALFATDGTASSLVRVSDTPPISAVAVSDGVIFYSSLGGGEQTGPLFGSFKTTGTLASTVPVSATLGPYALMSVGGEALMARGGSQPFAPAQLTDGTLAGMHRILVADGQPSIGSQCARMGMARLGNLALFPADDGVHGCELWKTDGTAAGTSLVVDLAPGAASTFPSQAPYPEGPTLVTIGSYAYFSVTNATGGFELWRTDGTAAGTFKLADLFGSFAYAAIVTGYKGNAYFVAPGGLWRSDGTVAGTSLVAPLTLASYAPHHLLYPGNDLLYAIAERGGSKADIVAYDGTTTTYVDSIDVADVMFNGSAVLGNRLIYHKLDDPFNVWVADGSAASARGLFPVGQHVTWFGRAFGNIGGAMLFAGTGGLWRSDGTTAGTYLISSQTVSLNAVNTGRHLVFTGTDGLYASDGTAAGTRRVDTGDATNVANDPMAPIPLFLGGNGLVFFPATTAGAGKELWVTDGFSARMVDDFTPGSGSSFFDYSGYWKTPGVALDNGFVMMASNEAGNLEPHLVDNTVRTLTVSTLGRGRVSGSAGTIDCGTRCSVQVASGTSVSLTAIPPPGSAFAGWFQSCGGVGCPAHLDRTRTISVTLDADTTVTAQFVSSPAASPPTDLNGDGHADLLWQNPSAGNGAWLMSDAHAASAGSITPPATGAAIRLSADFDGDGHTDLLWRTPQGAYYVTLMNGLAVTATAKVLDAGSGWEVLDKGDFDGDGRMDLVWRGPGNAYGLWLMNGTSVSAYGALTPPTPGATATLFGDFDGDGKADIVWRGTDGSVNVTLMNGLATTASATLLGPGTAWAPVMTGDFNGDGKQDLVWRHADGSYGLWIMNGVAAPTPFVFLGAGTGWTLMFTRDMDGDGKSDVIWQHADGSWAASTMDGGVRSATKIWMYGRTGWNIVASDDLDNDGKADLIWRSDSGQYAVWLMNGLDAASYAYILDGGSGWELVH